MKKELISILVGITLLGACTESEPKTVTIETNTSSEASVKKGAPAITFDETEFDFGEIEQGDTVVHVFAFTNTGTEPLIIYNAKAGCGCTIPEYEKDHPIMPGEKGEIKLIFNSKGKRGQQNKTVDITTNVSDIKEQVLLKGIVNVNEDI